MDFTLMDFSRKVIARAISRMAIAAAATQLAACTNLSGLGGGSDFQCKAPEGVPCQSVSGVHHNERAGNLPAQRMGLQVNNALPADAAAPVAASEPAEGGAQGAATQPDAPVMPSYRKAAAPGADQAKSGLAGLVGLGAIRSEPTVIRIWVAPWEDADGDLNDQSYVYLQLDSGRWLIEHNRAQIRREFAPQRPLPTPTPVSVGGPGSPTSPRAAMPAVAPALAPAPAARTMTKEDAIALGRAQAQAQALKPASKPATAADGPAAEVRP